MAEIKGFKQNSQHYLQKTFNNNKRSKDMDRLSSQINVQLKRKKAQSQKIAKKPQQTAK
jgi:hypothetical protein